MNFERNHLDSKKPLSGNRKGLMIQVRLELIDGLRREHESILTEATGYRLLSVGG
jgi:hypothetical protein